MMRAHTMHIRHVTPAKLAHKRDARRRRTSCTTGIRNPGAKRADGVWVRSGVDNDVNELGQHMACSYGWGRLGRVELVVCICTGEGPV